MATEYACAIAPAAANGSDPPSKLPAATEGQEDIDLNVCYELKGGSGIRPMKSGAEVSRAILLAHCREHLAAYKVPRGIQFVISVPTTSSGKIMRRMLKDVDDGTLAVK